MTRSTALAFSSPFFVAFLFAAAGSAHAEWYGRLETGVSKTRSANFKDTDFAANGVICNDAACSAPGTLNKLRNSYLIGGGVGYRLGSHLRGDVTLTSRADYSLAGSNGTGAQFKSNVRSTAAMLSGYIDFGSDGNLQPYVGAGAGRAENRMNRVQQTLAGGGTITTPGGKSGGRALSLMAGLGIPYSGSFLDVGLRYVDLGKISSAAGIAQRSSGNFPYSGGSGKLRAYELTVGIRF
jgi:opacity protein-like surface antigen